MINGLAKKQFLDTYKLKPWKNFENSYQNSWVLLDSLYSKGFCTDLDYILTQRLNKFCNNKLSLEAGLFLCHLIIASREGHLCVLVQNNTLKPSVEELWVGDADNRLKNEEIIELSHAILKGTKELPSELLSVYLEGSCEEEFSKPICQFQNRFYIQKNWRNETLLLKELIRIVQSIPRIEIDAESVGKELDLLILNGKLLKEQAEAIQRSLNSSISIVTGGPGTGKTYTASQMIKIFCDHKSTEFNRKVEIAIAAPTGKAVANLQKSLSKILNEVGNDSIFTIKTLHSLLEIRKNQEENQSQYRKLSADFVLVDESSMIDIQLMTRLFQHIKPGARLVLLGDPYQLPSVESGSIFLNLIESVNELDFKIAFSILSKCLRAELTTIVNFSNEVKQGHVENVLIGLQKHVFEGISHLFIDWNDKNASENIIKYSSKYFSGYLKDQPNEQEALNLFSTIRMLSTMRKGKFGFENLNSIMWKQFNKFAFYHGWLAIPIIIVTNDYKKDLFNGETGTLIRKLPLNEAKDEDYAVFPDRLNNEKFRKIPASFLPKYELAYCLSVHKSQGSEFEHIILVIPEGSEHFGREALYTGITRAKKKVDIVGSEQVIKKTVLKKGERLSGILERIKLFLSFDRNSSKLQKSRHS